VTGDRAVGGDRLPQQHAAVHAPHGVEVVGDLGVHLIGVVDDLNRHVLPEQRVDARVHDEARHVDAHVVVGLTRQHAQGLGLVPAVHLQGAVNALQPSPVAVSRRHQEGVKIHARQGRPAPAGASCGFA